MKLAAMELGFTVPTMGWSTVKSSAVTPMGITSKIQKINAQIISAMAFKPGCPSPSGAGIAVIKK